MDFTIKTYKNLLSSLQSKAYSFQSFEQFIEKPDKKKTVVLRHDVDRLPENALKIAKIESRLGIKGSYYFRAVPESWDECVIKEISSLGHEIGYHYENMDPVSLKFKFESSKLVPGTNEYNQLIDLAYEDFCVNLERLRKLVPVSTICMHGSPRSQFDNKAIWDKYDYREFGLIGEPYFDINFDEVFYLTDTGRRWDGWKTSVRDKVPQQKEWEKQGLIFHSTDDIINALKNNSFPDTAMLTFHPQRWNNNLLSWSNEYVSQNLKNSVKRFLIS